MTGVSPLVRTLLIYGICLPLAVFLGYLLANPVDYTTLSIFGLVVFILLTPLLLRWHHLLVIVFWNTTVVFFFLPGRPPFWLLLSGLSLAISIFQYLLNRKFKFISVPSVGRSLIFLTAVVLVTAKLTGGIGLNVFGSDVEGGKRYIYIFGAVAGYFAMTRRAIPRGRESFYVGLFFLASVATAIGELAPYVGSAFYPIFWFFPTTTDAIHAVTSITDSSSFYRWGTLGTSCYAAFCFMLCRYGIQGIFSWRHTGRLLILLAIAAAGLLGGFRTILILYLLTFVALFYLEGMFRSRLLPSFILMSVLGCSLLVAYVDRLPLTIQRSLSVLPLNVDPVAKSAAQDTTDWRIQMWKDVLPEIPPHLLLGKGLGISAAEMAKTLSTAGFDAAPEGSVLAGDYHNGPLSVIIPFGIFGVIGFLWFVAASLRVLYRNCQFGDPNNIRSNRLILAYFVAKLILFFFVFGGFYSDFAVFTGLVGLSISLNGGVAKRVRAPAPAPRSRIALVPSRLRPALQRPAGA